MLGLGLSLTTADVSGFDPSELSSLLHWYRLGTGITTATVAVEGSEDALLQVTRWSDQKGSNHVTPSSIEDASVMPQLQADGTIKFQGANDTLNFTSALSLRTFAVYFKIKWDASDTISSHDLMEGSNDFLKLASPTEARIKIGTGGSARHDFAINEIVEGNKFVVGFERKSNGDMEVYKDNVKATANDGDSLNRAITNVMSLTQMGKPGNSAFWHEVVICDNSLTDVERNNLYDYLLTVG